jgi:hypothetical protein
MPCRNIGSPTQPHSLASPTTRYARWIEAGRLPTVPGRDLCTSTVRSWPGWPSVVATTHGLGSAVAESARNRLTGLVTRVVKDRVMAQVDLQCGPFRIAR